MEVSISPVTAKYHVWGVSCPFCGKENVLSGRDEHGGWRWFCDELKCGAFGPIASRHSAAGNKWKRAATCKKKVGAS